MAYGKITIGAISTHALTWSATESFLTAQNIVTNFNSRAHVERDERHAVSVGLSNHFNSRAHVERD